METIIYSLIAISIISLIISLLSIKLYNTLSGRNLILDAIDRYRFSKLSLKEASQQWTSNTNRSEIIICLSTIPSRIHHLTPTLISLLAQKKAPKTIRLHIPYHSKREKTDYKIPQEFIDVPGITIIRCEDYGPATKFMSAVEECTPKQPLLILDDDYLYPPNFVERYDTTHQNHPDIIISSSGWLIPDDLIERPTTLWSNLRSIPPTPMLCPRLKKPVEVDIIEGYSGYLIQPRFFDKNALKAYNNAPKNAFFVDDIWISGHAKVSKWIYPEKRFCFEVKNANALYRASSLGLINKKGKGYPRNNTQVIQYFKDRWLFNQKETPHAH